jgi:hypothetical protein
MTEQLILTVAAIITSIGVILGSLVAIYKVARRIGDTIGVDKNGRTLSERLDRVEHQLWENGGSSLADRVNTIEEHVIKTSAKLELIENLLVNSSKATVEPIKKTRTKKNDLVA